MSQLFLFDVPAAAPAPKAKMVRRRVRKVSQPLLFEEEVEHKIAYYAGYAWGMRLGDQARWTAGVVITPKWVERFKKEKCELPVILDNGAWGERDNPGFSYKEQLKGLERAIDVLGRDRIIYVVAPDVVGNARESWRRTNLAIDAIDLPLLLPLQDASVTKDYIALARETGSGLFIGGSTKKFKRRCAERIRGLDQEVYVHVGRISKPHELLHATLMRADSFDTTTFMRWQNANQSIQWRPRFKKYVREQCSCSTAEESTRPTSS